MEILILVRDRSNFFDEDTTHQSDLVNIVASYFVIILEVWLVQHTLKLICYWQPSDYHQF